MFLAKSAFYYIIGVCLFFTACAKPDIAIEKDTVYDMPLKTIDAPQKDFLLGIGDVITVEFYYHADMNRALTIRPDGKITLPLKGETEAAGLSPNELKEKITELFSDVLRDPVITVTLNEYEKNNFVYVIGEVGRPDYYQMDSQTTLIQMLARAGGSLNTAELDTVLIISRTDEGRPLGRLVNVKKILSEGNIGDDVVLKKFDVVYVPKSTIAKTDLFVDQYINQFIPRVFRGVGFTFGSRLDD